MRRAANNRPPAGGPRTDYDCHAEMLAFDHLPKSVRRAMRDAAFNYSSQAVQNMLNDGAAPADIIAGLAESDRANGERHRRELEALRPGDRAKNVTP